MYKVTTYYTPDDYAVQQYKSAHMKIWADHMFYTRNAILSLLGDALDIQEINDRLLKNQEDIGNLLRPYYDSAKVDQLVELLKNHISLAVDIVTAAKSDKDTKELITQWQTNCKAIVNLLEDMNSFWEQSTLENLWDNHLTLTVNEIQYRMDKNWSSDIMNFDQIMENAYLIADCISQGVVFQNQIKFCTQSKDAPYERTE